MEDLLSDITAVPYSQPPRACPICLQQIPDDLLGCPVCFGGKAAIDNTTVAQAKALGAVVRRINAELRRLGRTERASKYRGRVVVSRAMGVQDAEDWAAQLAEERL